MALKWLVVPGVLLMGASCKLGPDYERPPVITPTDWRWKKAEPSENVSREGWWQLFKDEKLDALQQQALTGNWDLKAALARVDQARATARLDRSRFFPTLDGRGEFVRYRTSGNAPSPVNFPVPSFIQEQWSIPFDLSYEVDLWGKVRRSFESAQNLAFAAEAARQSVLLTLQADIAANYFSTLFAEREVELLQKAIELREEALKIFEQRLEAGIGNEFEVVRARAEVASSKADLNNARRRSAELLNALAVLCGVAPSQFNLEVSKSEPPVPAVAAELPSSLLERRPDIAQAEREMAARNAQIGVAKTAFFPSIRLTGNGGLMSGELSDLFSWESRTWAIGPSVSVPIFQAGRGGANLARARAAHEESVAIYQQKVLVGFREVEDSLVALERLADEIGHRQIAAKSSTDAARLSLERYQAGAINFLEVIDSENARLLNELSRLRTANQQMLATVRLIKALGGGWKSSYAVKN